MQDSDKLFQDGNKLDKPMTGLDTVGRTSDESGSANADSDKSTGNGEKLDYSSDVEVDGDKKKLDSTDEATSGDAAMTAEVLSIQIYGENKI